MGITRQIVKDYKRAYYIETGCATGQGLDVALRAGYRVIKGIECNPDFLEVLNYKYSDIDQIEILWGKSEDVLPNVIKMLGEIGRSALIFLDAHKVSPWKDETNPLIEELKIIGAGRMNSHIIAIDDVRLFGTELAPKEEVYTALKSINGSYKFKLEDSSTHTKDILVAYL
jgi:hypothetical protein